MGIYDLTLGTARPEPASLTQAAASALEASSTENVLVANLSKREIPSLNGLRGLAALVVVVYHFLIDRSPAIGAVFPGPYAVTLFFELSGLLITWLLLKEIDQTGRLNLRDFYARRALRLFPVFYLVWILCRISGPFAGEWATFFYMGDYYHALTRHYNILTMSWSLGVEEKFYLLWPFVLARVERQRSLKLIFALLIAEPIYRSILISLGHREYTWFAFDTRFDAILVGCAIAILAKKGWIAPRWLSHPFTPIVALILIFALQDQGDIVTYLLAVMLVSVICRPVAFLNNPIAKFAGAISYSLYLGHTYAREVLWQPLLDTPLRNHAFLSVTSQIAISIALAAALHYSVERPFLHLKSRIHRRR